MKARVALGVALAMVGPASATVAPPSTVTAACAVEGVWQLYAFLSGRPLTAPEKLLLKRETLKHSAEILPSECADIRTQSALVNVKDPILRADRLAGIHNILWFRLDAADPRRALLQHIAPIVLQDRTRKVVIRRRAIEAFMASRAFAAAKWGLAAPASTVTREVAELRSDYRQTRPEIVQFIQYQESYWEALRRGWAGKPQGWRQNTLARLGRPKTRNELDGRTAQLQLAVVSSTARANEAAALARFRRKVASYDAAIQDAAAKGGFLAGIYGSR